MNKATEALKDKFSRYEFMDDAIKWFTLNFQKLSDLFSNYTLRDYIFEPFKGVFQSPKQSLDTDIYLTITSVALLNAVLAGLAWVWRLVTG